MKFYYDMLIPLMPEQKLNPETNEMQPDECAIALKNALINLADYQLNSNPIHLYQAMLNVCNAFKTDLVDTIHSALTIDIEECDYADNAALMLLDTIKPNAAPFDLYKFIGYLLMGAHIALDVLRNVENEPIMDNSDSNDDNVDENVVEPPMRFDVDNPKFIEVPES